MHDPEVGEQLDQYCLTELLSRGGMASVFKAVDVESGQEVVLKIPYIQYESDVFFYQRFEREERIGQDMDHPGLVRMLAPRDSTFRTPLPGLDPAPLAPIPPPARGPRIARRVRRWIATAVFGAIPIGLASLVWLSRPNAAPAPAPAVAGGP